jgi:release factor glutamine methyltransferase
VPGGWLLLEHGWQQGEAVRALLASAGLLEVATARDLAQHERVSLGRRPD